MTKRKREKEELVEIIKEEDDTDVPVPTENKIKEFIVNMKN